MADTKTSALPAAAALDGTEIVPLVQSSVLVRTTAQAIANRAALTIGTTAITGGTTTRLLFDAAGVVSETDGATWSATNKALTVGGATVTTSNPVLDLSQTWNAGAVAFTALKLNVTNTASAAASLLLDLQVGGTSQFKVDKAGNVTLSPANTANIYLYSNTAVGSIKTDSTNYGIIISASTVNDFWFADRLSMNASKYIGWVSGTNAVAGADLILARKAAASLRMGAADAAAPVAQTLGVQSVVAGTSNTAGANWTLAGSQGTGTGAGGSIIFQTAPAGSTGSAQNALAAVLTLDSTKQAAFTGHMQMTEITAPAAGAANTVRIYAEDNGAGKTRLMALFASGAAQQVAIEP